MMKNQADYLIYNSSVVIKTQLALSVS